MFRFVKTRGVQSHTHNLSWHLGCVRSSSIMERTTMLMADTHTFWLCCCCCCCCCFSTGASLRCLCYADVFTRLLLAAAAARALLFFYIVLSFCFGLHRHYTHYWPVRVARPTLPPRVVTSDVTRVRIKTRANRQIFTLFYKNP